MSSVLLSAEQEKYVVNWFLKQKEERPDDWYYTGYAVKDRKTDLKLWLTDIFFIEIQDIHLSSGERVTVLFRFWNKIRLWNAFKHYKADKDEVFDELKRRME